MGSILAVLVNIGGNYERSKGKLQVEKAIMHETESIFHLTNTTPLVDKECFSPLDRFGFYLQRTRQCGPRTVLLGL